MTAKRLVRVLLLIALIGGVAVAGLFLSRSRCDYRCKAIELFRNPVFFELNRSVTEAKRKGVPIEVRRDFFSEAQLKESRIGVWAVMDNGTILLTRSDDELLFIAEPLVREGAVAWRCKVYPEPVNYPLCP
jgi:hypothetical protein